MRGRIAVFLLLSLGGCGGSGHPPTARAVATPAYLPIGDGYRTDVVLDGSGSDDLADDPLGARPLRFAWAIADPPPHVFTVLDAPRATVRLAADAPTTIVLTVTDEDGDAGRATLHVGVSVPR